MQGGRGELRERLVPWRKPSRGGDTGDSRQDLSSRIALLRASVGSTDLGYNVSIKIQWKMMNRGSSQMSFTRESLPCYLGPPVSSLCHPGAKFHTSNLVSPPYPELPQPHQRLNIKRPLSLQGTEGQMPLPSMRNQDEPSGPWGWMSMRISKRFGNIRRSSKNVRRGWL